MSDLDSRNAVSLVVAHERASFGGGGVWVQRWPIALLGTSLNWESGLSPDPDMNLGVEMMGNSEPVLCN